MQMFVLDPSPGISAQCLADCHIRVIGREITMCLSSWYAKNMGHEDELPYKAFNHLVVEQLADQRTRAWAVLNADSIFMEFDYRFGKRHASQEKLKQLLRYRAKYGDNALLLGMTSARFSFVEKDIGVKPGLTLYEAIELYRDYYRRKLATIKVPVVYTRRQKPDWFFWRQYEQATSKTAQTRYLGLGL